MFFGFTNSSLAGSGLSNLTFASRRIGRDRRGVVREMEGRMVALDRAQALVELGLDCRVLDANALFVALLGTTSDAILGQPYTALLTEAERAGPVFRQLQDRLSRSEPASARLQHVTRDNGALELRITFMPVTGDDGKVARLFGVATDETEIARNEGQLSAIDQVQSVIELGMDGKILTANKNFLAGVGYALEEVRGQHHSMFVDPPERATPEYRLFWEKLNRGETIVSAHKRIAKGGREFWSQAIYTPILDQNGKPFKVVGYITDVTEQKLVMANFQGQLAAIAKVQAVIEFSLDGKVLTANENFLTTLGYALEEIRGQHHSMFVDPAYRSSPEYRLFWDKLGRGDFDAGHYKRLAKGGREVWLQASYNPIFDASGKPFKVVKYATDITEQKLATANFEGQLAAIGKAQAVIEFGTDGKILTANENFLATLGYTLEEIRGQHHSMFVDPAHRTSPEYRLFWDKLGRGEFDAGQYKRIGKGGREVWLQASYNPILDMNGKPFKVVKYATNITEQKLATANFEGQLAAIGKAQAVIEFGIDGKVLFANENFLTALGYTLEEIRGQHHSLFVDPVFRASPDYRLFWDKLGRGEFDAGQYKRIGKGGREVWIQASYNPIFDLSGKPFKVVKYATDITEQKMSTANFEGQLAAIGKAQAVIEFGLDGKVLTANNNFLDHAWLHAGRNSRSASQHVRRSRVPDQPGLSAVLGQTWPRGTRRRSLQADRQRRPRGVAAGQLQPYLRSERQAVQGGKICHRHNRTKDGHRQFRGSACGHRQGAGGDRIRAGRKSNRPPTKTSSTPSGTRCLRSWAVTTASSLNRRLPEPPITARFGKSSGAGNTTPDNTSVLPRAAGRCGCRPATTRFST